MTPKQTLLVFSAVIGIFAILFALLFELREVTDTNWSHNYGYESKEAYGTYSFAKMITNKYGEENMVFATDTLLPHIDSPGYVYILFGGYINLDSVRTNRLISFLSQGNEVLIISTDLYLYAGDSTFELDYYTHSYVDSSLDVTNQLSGNSYQFQYYNDDLIRPQKYQYDVLVLPYYEDSSAVLPILSVQDSMGIYTKVNIGEYAMYMHSVPLMFTNMAAIQGFYLDHMNDVFRPFSHRNIILDHELFDHIEVDNDTSPLQFVLSQASLSWAYYCFILLTLLFIVFRGKRRQREIKLLPVNHNTSLDYTQTLSRLHFSQNQNQKLILHLRDIFYHKIEHRYFLNKSNTNFVEILSKKSKISESDINKILDRFKNAEENFTFSDIQLSKLFNRIESFYNKWK